MLSLHMASRIKVLFCFCIFGCMQQSIRAQQMPLPRLDFSCQNCLPADVLVQLSKQTGINIAFNDRIFAQCPPISIEVSQTPFSNLLDRVLACAHAAYKFDGEQVLIFRKTARYTLSGYVEDAETGERLLGASIRVANNPKIGASTNEFGFFSLKMDEGEHTLVVSYIGYQPKVAPLLLESTQILKVRLQPDNKLPEVVVYGNSTSTVRDQVVGTPKDLALENLKFYPMPGGEADIIRLAALQPGIQTGADGLGGMHVRGGNADQNLFLLDDVPVYSPGHALGLFSIFNPVMVNNARLWKGDFPARYGGRVSSVLDVRTRDGNFKKYETSLHTGLFAATLATEGPIQKNKCSYLFGLRYTYFDPWIRFLSTKGNLLTAPGYKPGYRFYDANLKLNYIFSENDRVYLSLYRGGDFFRNQFKQGYNTTNGLINETYQLNSSWGNEIAALRWNHLIRKNLFTNTTFRYSKYVYQSQLSFNSTIYYSTGKENVLADYAQLYQTLIRDGSVKTDFTWYLNPKLTLRWGGNYTKHTFQPGALSANLQQTGQAPGVLDSLETVLVNNALISSDETEAYFDVEYSPFQHWKIESGLNTAVFHSDGTSYTSMQPRFRIQRSGEKGWNYWGGFYKNTQFLHQIGTFNISLPFELWVPSTRLVKPEQVWQISSGLGWQRNGWGFQLEVYYKKMGRVLAFISNNEALYTGGAEDASGWEDRIVSGAGQSRGLEFLFEKNKGRTNWSLAYTLAKSVRQFPDINSGKVYPFRYDRRHDLKCTVQQRLASWCQATAMWSFSTGNPITLAAVKFRHESVEGQIQRDVYAYTEVNGYRLPSYHRFDVALNAHFKTRRTNHLIQMGVYNTYNRSNPFFIYVDAGSNIKGKAIQYTLLPVLPSFKYEIKF